MTSPDQADIRPCPDATRGSRSLSAEARRVTWVKQNGPSVAVNKAFALPCIPANAIKRLRGQTVLWFLGLIATMAVVSVGVYSVGQVTSEKQKIVNAADAAAYSGALVQARALNMVAYGNRAEIANEVFLAQVISLQSWMRYMETTIESAKYVAAAFSWTGVGAAVYSVLNTVEQVMSSANQAYEAFPPAAAALVEGYATGLSAASRLILNGPAMALAAKQAGDNVLRANVANQNGASDTAPVSIYGVELGALNIISWNQAFAEYTQSKQIHNSSDGRKTAADILLASRDAFSENRVGPSSYLLRLLWGSASIGFCPAEFGSSRDGVTQLKDYERWEAQDTSEYYVATGVKCRKNGVPFGWGRSTIADQETQGDRRTSPHRRAGSLAYSDNPATNQGWSGVKALFDLDRDQTNGRPKKEEFNFYFAAAKPKASVKTADQMGIYQADSAAMNLGNTKMDPKTLGDQIAATSGARVFFARPWRDNRDFTGTPLFRADQHKEVGSLYNPYWQARLATPSWEAVLATYQGNLPISVFSQNSDVLP